MLSINNIRAEWHHESHGIVKTDKSDLIFALILNYFSHYYFDHQKGMEMHNLGLILPDLVRNFMRGQKLFPQILPESEEYLEQLRIGTNTHFSRDKKFHASPYFEVQSKNITEVIKPVFQSAGIPRYWFAAHVLTEMLIDRVLIKQNPAMALDFYADLENAQTEAIDVFLKSRNISDTPVFIERLTRFNQSKYLLQYVHDKAMVYSLNRIFMFTGADKEWNSEQTILLENLMPAAESIIFESLDTLKQEML